MYAASTIRKIFMLAAAICFAGCGFGPSSYTWSEEVQLLDGSIISVSRTTRYSKTLHEVGGPSSAILADASLQLPLMGAIQPPIWRLRLYPIHVDRLPATNEWIVIADMYRLGDGGGALCDIWNLYGRPETPEVAFALRGTNWVQIPLPEILVDKTVNLIPGIPEEDMGVVTLSAKKYWRTNTGLRFGTIRSSQQLSSGRTIAASCERTARAIEELKRKGHP